MAKTNSQVTTLDDAEDASAMNPTGDAALAASAVSPLIVGENHDSELSGERRTVTIHEGNGDGGSDAVFMSLNGYAYQAPRGVPVSLPVEVLENCLRNAKTTVYTALSGGAVGERTIPRFAFSAE